MARFAWAVGSLTAELTLPRPLLFRNGSLGRFRTRYRSISLDQRTTVTELLTSAGADVVEGRLRYYTEPAELAAMIEDAASGALLTYEHSNGLVFSDLLLEDAGNLTEIIPDANRYGFGEWERTLRLRHVGGSLNLIADPLPESFDDAGWQKVGTTTIDPDVAIAPDGTATADRINNIMDATGERLTEVISTGAIPDKHFMFSMYLKGEGVGVGQVARIQITRNTGTAVSANAEHTLTADWVRVSTVITTLGDTDGLKAGIVNTGAASANSALIWGAHVEELSTASAAHPAYVPVSKRTLWQLFPPVTV